MLQMMGLKRGPAGLALGWSLTLATFPGCASCSGSDSGAGASDDASAEAADGSLADRNSSVGPDGTSGGEGSTDSAATEATADSPADAPDSRFSDAPPSDSEADGHKAGRDAAEDAPTDSPLRDSSKNDADVNGHALSFNGTDEFVVGQDPTSGSAQGTVELWLNVRTFTVGANGTFALAEAQYAPGGGGAEDYLGLGTHPSCATAGALCFGLFETAPPEAWHFASSTIVPAPGTWYHLAGTWGPAGIVLFVNGKQAATDPFTGSVMPTTFLLAGSSSWSQSFIDGTIDEVRVWNVQRTAAEIRTFMNVEATGSEIGLVTLWHLDDGTGTTAHDSSPSGNDGTLSGTTAGDLPQWVVSTAP